MLPFVIEALEGMSLRGGDLGGGDRGDGPSNFVGGGTEAPLSPQYFMNVVIIY